ncbi:unnamed protein product [Sphagnum balticum]
MAPTKKKRSYEWKDLYMNKYVEEEKSDNNDIGLPINTNNVDAINEVVDGGGNKRKQRKHTANHKQWTGPTFRTDNFTKHLQQQHTKRWEEYNQLKQSYIQKCAKVVSASREELGQAAKIGYGAASRTGVRKGIVFRIQTVATKGLIRVWCGAHQLDLALKKALGCLLEAFLTMLTTMIAYLRRQ